METRRTHSHDPAKARAFAIKWHGTQQYGNEPYVVHLDEVVAILRNLDAEDWQLCAAYLHDVLEDTDCTPELIAEEFGPEVLHWVLTVTGVGTNRKEKQAHIARQLAADTTGAVRLKLADRLASARRVAKENDKRRRAMLRKDIPLYSTLFEAASPALHAELTRCLA